MHFSNKKKSIFCFNFFSRSLGEKNRQIRCHRTTEFLRKYSKSLDIGTWELFWKIIRLAHLSWRLGKMVCYGTRERESWAIWVDDSKPFEPRIFLPASRERKRERKRKRSLGIEFLSSSCSLGAFVKRKKSLRSVRSTRRRKNSMKAKKWSTILSWGSFSLVAYEKQKRFDIFFHSFSLPLSERERTEVTIKTCNQENALLRWDTSFVLS